MEVPFSRPYIDEAVVAEVNDCLTGTGWLTSGPKVRALEEEISKLTSTPVLAVNSWASGATLVLRHFGIGPGDEVIVPAYTYSATALVAHHLGAKIVMVDVGADFNINPEVVMRAITPRTKAVISVDIGGWPCDYAHLKEILNSESTRKIFTPGNERQAMLGRPLLLSDAAHSIGAMYKGKPSGSLADASVFSFHSVKNITSGEGGAVCLALPEPFDNTAESGFLRICALYGQTRSAYDKNQPGSWKYDIVAPGIKANMPDISAAIALAQIRQYREKLLPGRQSIFNTYRAGLENFDWAVLPEEKTPEKTSSYHLFMLRISDADEAKRDHIIAELANRGVGANVHYIPMPMLSFFKTMGFDMHDYPVAYQLYANEISLPVYNTLRPEQVEYVVDCLKKVCS
jgi:dTDP-4-amino-4,6-dideoxygalactose transaminase